MGHNTCKSMGRVLCVVRRYRISFAVSVNFVDYTSYDVIV